MGSRCANTFSYCRLRMSEAASKPSVMVDPVNGHREGVPGASVNQRNLFGENQLLHGTADCCRSVSAGPVDRARRDNTPTPCTSPA